MLDEPTLATLQTGRYQTYDGQLVILLYRLREHWYGHFADKDPGRNTEKWNQDGTHAGNPDWNLKVLEFDD